MDRSLKIFLRIVFLLGIFFAFTSLRAQNFQWHLQAIIPEDSLATGNLYFSDSLHGYFLGQKILPVEYICHYCPKTYKQIVFYRTTDGGSSWNKIDFAAVYGNDLISYDSVLGRNLNLTFAAIPNSSACVVSNIANLKDNYVDNFDTLKFYWSQDYGNSWYPRQTFPATKAGDFIWEAAPANHEIIALRFNDETFTDNARANIGKISFSIDNGSTIQDLRWDSTLLKSFSYNTFHAGSKTYSINIADHFFDYFNDSTWIIIVRDSLNPVIKYPSYRLLTLISTDFGYSWTPFRNLLPRLGDVNFNGVLFYKFQCIHGTSNAYLFPYNFENSVFSNGGLAGSGVNYYYTSDFGKTWNNDTSFGLSCKDGYAVAPGEVWCTVPPHNNGQRAFPASWILHTRDNGRNWNIDSGSLANDGLYDGIQIKFSGPRHGWIVAQSKGNHTTAIFQYLSLSNKVETIGPLQYPSLVYPNPANYEVNIETAPTRSVHLVDILGREVMRGETSQQGKITFNISRLSKGIYSIHLDGNDSIRLIGKLIVTGK
jgi:hypothetical protein